jgi:replication initiation protein RepC
MQCWRRDKADSVGHKKSVSSVFNLFAPQPPYLRRPSPTWPEVVDAADWLRHELDVSKPLWGEACLAMGREQAAIALAVVSTKEPGHFRTTAGGYFHGMVAKAKAGALNLDRTLWAMRRADEPKLRSQSATGGGGCRPSERPWS